MHFHKLTFTVLISLKSSTNKTSLQTFTQLFEFNKQNPLHPHPKTSNPSLFTILFPIIISLPTCAMFSCNCHTEWCYYITQQKFVMTEVQILQEFNDRNLHTPNESTEGHKLPRIDRNISRDGARSKAEKRKTPPLLPSIKQSATPLQPAEDQEPEPDSFAMQIEERLRMVLENVNQGEDLPAESGEQSEVDFEALIQQNRQKLKQNKQARQPGEREGREGKPRSNTLKNKNQNSIYQKRMKEYRQASIENKYIQKRKEIIAIKQEAIERGNDKLRLTKPKEQNLKNSSGGVPKPTLPKSNNRLKNSASQRKPEETEPLAAPNQAKTADLFENIHQFLENPHKGRIVSEARKASKDNIRELTEKIKQINEKLGVKEEQEEKAVGGGAIEQKTVLDWKRLEYNRGSNFRCHYDSNFQKEVDRIGSLQQKTAHSLNRFLDHQKTLVALTLLKKVSKRPEERTT